MQNSKILFICVNYNSFAETKALVADLEKQSEKSALDILVVNNTPSDTKALEILKTSPLSLTLLSPQENLGYFGAAHYAFDKYLETNSLPEFVIVSNSDIRIQDADFMKKVLVLSQSQKKKIAVFGPSIFSLLSGKNQNPHMRERPTSWRMHAYKYIFGNYLTSTAYHLLSLAKNRLRQANQAVINESSSTIYSAHGAFLIFHRSYFEAGGHLQHGTFLFGEEIFVAEICLKLGLEIRFEPKLKVSHAEHVSTRLIPDRKISRFIAESARYCAERFF